MRKTLALQKSIPISIRTWHDIRGVDYCELTINNVLIGKFDIHSMKKLECALDSSFESDKKYDFNAKTIKLQKGELLINDFPICALSPRGLWAINGAFTKVTSYVINIHRDHLCWLYSWSLDWHVENHSAFVERVETIDYKKTLKVLKKKYEKLVEHNVYYAFQIIEYRGKDYNALIYNDSVGCVPENFDEKIRERIFRNQ